MDSLRAGVLVEIKKDKVLAFLNPEFTQHNKQINIKGLQENKQSDMYTAKRLM